MLSYLLTSGLAPYIQIIFAMLLGILIGLERHYAGKSAGMRTYSLVTTGTCFLMLLPALVGGGTFDPLRLVPGIVTGIGFLGAGIIMHRESRLIGLTTAAGIWVAAAIGIAVGAGFLGLATFVTFLTIFIFSVLEKFENYFGSNNNNI